MNGNIIKSCLYFCLLAYSIITAGCGQQAYNKRYYVLNIERKTETAKTNNKNILEVRRFTIDSVFESKGLVYRKGEFEYETDFYNEFLISPATMVTEKTRTWLSKSGLFARVLDKGSYIEPTHLLESNITAFFGDFREKSTASAFAEISFFLIEQKPSKESIVFTKTYNAAFPLKSNNPKDMVEALDLCLRKILTNLEKDLTERLL